MPSTGIEPTARSAESSVMTMPIFSASSPVPRSSRRGSIVVEVVSSVTVCVDLPCQRASVGCPGVGLRKAYPHGHRRPLARLPGLLRAAGRQLREPRGAAHQRDPRLHLDAADAPAAREAHPPCGGVRHLPVLVPHA
ncbi:hypothetical protein CURTO8I2_290087 [Curtobacterium sp. 8I-2]|nr:hypothetical protein CURTO8I2_290087 [Curtobacterium sp. 8I-2]